MRRSLVLLVLCSLLVLAAPAWAAPANDTYAGAVPVAVPGTSAPVDTAGATLDAADAEVGALCNVPSGATLTNTVWYRFTPTEDAQVLVAPTADYPVAGAVVTGGPGSFSLVGCFIGSRVVPVTAGTTYYVVVADSSGGDGGTLQLALTPGEPPTASVTVTGATVRRGVATVKGTVTCTEGAQASFFGSLAQDLGPIATRFGGGYASLSCDGTEQTWSVEVTPYAGRFTGGKAQLYLFWNVWSPFGSDYGEKQAVIRLRG